MIQVLEFVAEMRHSQEMLKNPSLRWIGIFLLSTVLTGLTLRWQLAGYQWNWASQLDWRRAHSHLGFYGVLFPITWMVFRTYGAWSPSRAIWRAYGALVAMAGLSFLWQGYGFFSILASTGILIVWLIFAWKNRSSLNFRQRDWLSSAPLSILLAAFMIPAVAVFAHRNSFLANEIARTFLTLLLFGVFIPSALRLLKIPPGKSLLWMLSTIAAALHLTGLAPHPLFGLGLIWIAFEILRSFYQAPWKTGISQSFDPRLAMGWGVLALSLALTGAGILPYSYYQAIAGIHFLVLGPLLMSFGLVYLKLRPPAWLRLAYELSLGTMVVSIALQSWVSRSLTGIAALSGTFLVLSMIGILITNRSSFNDPI